MLFWVRFALRALLWRVRGTFYGYGQRDQGYWGRRTHPGGCAGVTVAVSHRSHGPYCQNGVLGAFCVPSSIVARPSHFLWIWPTRPGLFGSANTPRRLRRRHGGCIPPLAWSILPKCCFGCVLRSELCRGTSVALYMDMAIAIWAFQPWEHTLIGAKVSHFLHRPLHHR